MSRTEGRFREWWGDELGEHGFTMMPKALQQNRNELGLSNPRNTGLRDALESYIDWIQGPDLTVQMSDRRAAEYQGCSRRTAVRRREKLRDLGLLSWIGDNKSGKPVVISLIPLRDRLIETVRKRGMTLIDDTPPPNTAEQGYDTKGDTPPVTPDDIPGATPKSGIPLKTLLKTDNKRPSPDGAFFEHGSIEWLTEKARNYVFDGARGRAHFDDAFQDYSQSKKREAWKRALAQNEEQVVERASP